MRNSRLSNKEKKMNKEEIYQKVLKKHWNAGDMNSLEILGTFGRELIEETIKELKKP